MEYKEQSVKCQNCKQDFAIEPEDFNFYKKIDVPPPTFCPECRLRRRFCFLNLNKFYTRECDKCNKKIIAVHSPSRPFKVYCQKCWWADDWDGTEYSMEYDPERHFFDQLLELRDRSIFMSVETLAPTNVRTEYTNASGWQKDCFMTMFADYCENCAYLTMVAHAKDSMDCYRVKESERCYECTGIYKSYGCKYCEEIDACVDCFACRSCWNCSDCVGCINMRGKKYCIFNEQYTKEEYEKKVAEMRLDTYEGQQKVLARAKEFWKNFPRKSFLGNSLNKNVTGDIIYESKNVKDSYMVSGAEDSRYVQYLSLASSKDCYDYTSWGRGAELLYECYAVGGGAFNNRFSSECWPEASNTEYSYYAIQPKDCFGCVNLKRKQYCILNKQYSKEQYKKLKAKIIEDIKKNPWKSQNGNVYTYGEFLPPELSPFGYNETLTNEYYPMTKAEVEKAGFNWFDMEESEYKIELKSEDLPQTNNELTEDFVGKAIGCISCSSGYNISKKEFDILKVLGQPAPRACYKCRNQRRFDVVNAPKLYDRECDKCSTDIRTSYAPDRPEIVYCEKCYQQEVY